MFSISIITATYNSENTIQHCLTSLVDQSFPFEHIIIDGGSTDRTIDIIKSHKLPPSHFISEPDNGLYDAMNKGIALANGEVIGILNSDDFYANNQVLKKVNELFRKNEIDSCYADLQYVDANNTSKVTRNWKAGEFKRNTFFSGWMPPHPTFFVRRKMYEKYGGFNLNFGSASDYELMLRFLVKHRISTAYIPEVLVYMRSGGVSNSSLKNRIKANRMDKRAWIENGLKPYPWTTIFKPLRKLGQYFIK